MGRVVSLGSVNVDRVRTVTESELESLAARYDWFPARSQTVEVETLPDGFAGPPDDVRHGGKGANQAVAAAAAGTEAVLLGRVGTDHGEFGVIDELDGAGVAIDGVTTADAPTGTADVFVDGHGDNRIVVRPGANDTIDSAYVEAHYETVLDADCLLLQNEIPVEPVAALLADLASEPEAERPRTVLDPAPADGAAALLTCDAVDYLTPNEHEYAALEPALDAFEGTVVRKNGGDDVVVENDHEFRVTPPRVDPVDTTGAGDVLNGFFAARLAAGAPLREAVRAGTVAGSLSTLAEGARGGIPTLEDVQAFRE